VEEIWILYWILWLLSIVSSYNDLWMTESLNHFLPKCFIEKKYAEAKSYLTYAFLTQLISGIIIAVLFFCFSEFIAINYFKSVMAIETLKIFSFYFLWYNFFQVLVTFFISTQNTFFTKITDFFRIWSIALLTSLLFFLNSWSLLNYSISRVAWLYISVLVAIFIFYKFYYKEYFSWIAVLWEKKLYKKISNYAIIVFLSASWWTILWQIDLQMVLFFLWAKNAWFYTNYLSISALFWLIIWPIYWLLFPVFSELHTKKEYGRIKQLRNILTNNFILVTIVYSTFFFIFSEPISYVLFWSKFLVSWAILKYSILFMVFNLLMSFNFTLMSWIAMIKERLRIITFIVLFNILSNYILIKIIWAYWAALATWIWWLLMWLWSEFYIHKQFPIDLELKHILLNIAWFLLIGIISFTYLLPLLHEWSRSTVLFTMIYVVLLFIVLFYIINRNKIIALYKEIMTIYND